MSLWGIFIMPAHFAVAKDAKMILPLKTFKLSDAHDLVVIFPCNEMVGKPITFKIFQKIIEVPARRNFSDHERLPTLMMKDVEHKQ